jgi:hypothetical protein
MTFAAGQELIDLGQRKSGEGMEIFWGELGPRLQE